MDFRVSSFADPLHRRGFTVLFDKAKNNIFGSHEPVEKIFVLRKA